MERCVSEFKTNNDNRRYSDCQLNYQNIRILFDSLQTRQISYFLHERMSAIKFMRFLNNLLKHKHINFFYCSTLFLKQLFIYLVFIKMWRKFKEYNARFFIFAESTDRNDCQSCCIHRIFPRICPMGKSGSDTVSIWNDRHGSFDFAHRLTFSTFGNKPLWF